MPPAAICRRRPFAAVPTPPPPDTLRTRLENLLHALPDYVDRVASQIEDTAAEVPDQARRLFSKDGPLGALQFWRDNRTDIEKSRQQLLDVGDSILQRNPDAFRKRASALDFRWLVPKPVERGTVSEDPLSTVIDANTADLDVPSQLRNAAAFAVDSFTPWDFDRHDFGLTFANSWMDAQALPMGALGFGRDSGLVVKMTSTIKPLEREWKLTARAKLLETGPGAVVFGKAGVYLAGDAPAYIGVEADRVWKVPRWRGGKVFVNVNYRSSRKPATDPVKMSTGVQQDFEIGNFVLTLRVGVDPMERRKIFVTPVPNGEYF